MLHKQNYLAEIKSPENPMNTNPVETKMKNRIIKFRAWSGESMIYSGDKKGGTTSWWTSGDLLERFSSSVMQFTGLHDKYGIEIYEGDIIETGKGIRYTAFWSDNKCAFAGRTFNVFKKWGTKPNGAEPQQTKWLYKSAAYLAEQYVIGNVYENPELLNPQDHDGNNK